MVREYPIKPGSNILDDNLLACSDAHVSAVFDMAAGQPGREFTGGLEAARLKDWHVKRLRELKPRQLFFAYDTPDDLAPLQGAGEMLQDAGFTMSSRVLRAFVLVGYPGDKIPAAEQRMHHTLQAGFTPMAML